MVDLQTISIVLASASVSIAAIYYAFTLRYTRINMKTTLETRQAQMFMNVYNQSHNDPTFMEAHSKFVRLQWKNFDEFLELFDYENPDALENRRAGERLFGFYEGLGVLVKENYLDIRLVALLMTGMTRRFWEKLAPIVEDYREYANFPRWLSETEYLYNELMKYVEEHPELKT